MKENNNPDVCPCCGQRISTKPRRYFFWEQWAKPYGVQLGRILNMPTKELHRYDLASFYNSEEVPYFEGGLAVTRIPKPKSLYDWEKQNPMPMSKISHIDFTVQLAQRVEHLESLLREKGMKI